DKLRPRLGGDGRKLLLIQRRGVIDMDRGRSCGVQCVLEQHNASPARTDSQRTAACASAQLSAPSRYMMRNGRDRRAPLIDNRPALISRSAFLSHWIFR